jgi:crotonobetainyl-CoA hydratase
VEAYYEGEGAMTGSGAVQVPTAGGDDVLVEQRGHVLLVTINRPGARNAVNTKVTLGIGEALDYATSSLACGS